MQGRMDAAIIERLADLTLAASPIAWIIGRHPHRNSLLGRASSPAEEEYIAAGDFPHLKNDG